MIEESPSCRSAAFGHQLADLADRMSRLAESLATTFEDAAVRGDSTRRLAFARKERDEAARLRTLAAELRRRLATSEHGARLPRDEPDDPDTHAPGPA